MAYSRRRLRKHSRESRATKVLWVQLWSTMKVGGSTAPQCVLRYLTNSQRLPIRYSGQIHAGQHYHRSVRWPNESAGGQGTKCGEGLGSFQRHDIPAGAIQEARNHGGTRQGLHPDCHPKPNRLNGMVHRDYC